MNNEGIFDLFINFFQSSLHNFNVHMFYASVSGVCHEARFKNSCCHDINVRKSIL